MSNTLGTKRLGAVLALIVAFAIALAMTITPAAHADANAIGNIDTTKTGSLTIHKYTNPAFGDKGNGSEITTGLPADSRKLDGAKFKVQKVDNIDLTTNAGWDAVKTATTDNVAGNLDNGTEQTTVGGVATFTNLPLGLYLVTETETPTNVENAAAPFLVTIPFSTQGQTEAVPGAVDGWLYDVHVYPKNEIDTKLKKKLADTQTAVKAGDDLKWELTVPIPTTQKAFFSFKIVDTLQNSTFSTTNDSTVAIGKTAFVKDTDFTLENRGDVEATIQFTEAGVKKLNQNAGKTLTVELYATTKATVTDNAVQNNSFKTVYELATNPFDPTDPDKVNPKDPNEPEGGDEYAPPTDPNQIPTAYFGDYVISKQSSVGNAPIDGAVFKLYANEAAYNDDTNGDQQIAIAEADTNTPGKLIFKDFYLGDTAAATKTFYLVETQAPAGFKLTANNGHEITIHHTATEPTAGDSFEVIQNTPYEDGDLPDLPLTGASGKLLMTLGGAAIVLFAAGTVLVTRRRKA